MKYKKEFVMNRNTKTSSLTEAAMICGVLVIMAMLSAYIFPFIDFFFPVPALIFSRRRGFKYSSLAVVAALIIVTIILGPINGLNYLILYAPIAIAMSYLIDKDKKASTVLIGGAVATLISVVVSLFILDKIVGVGVTEQITAYIKEIFDMQEKIINSIGSKEQIELIKEMPEVIIELVVNLLPVIIMAMSLALAYINYVIAQKLALRFKIEMKQLKDIAFFSLPRNFMISIAFFFILSYVLRGFNFPNIDVIISNIVVIVQIALILQGLALAKFYMAQKRVNGFLRVIVFIFIIFNPIIMSIMTAIAIADLIFDFRKLRTRT